VTDNMICLLARDAQPAVPAYSSPAARLLRSKSRAGVRNPLNRDVRMKEELYAKDPS
jgi:hypothetical protein